MKRPRSSRQGAALVIVAGTLASLMAMVALVVDIGYLYVLRARFQGVLDVAAVSALQSMDGARPALEQQSKVEALARRILSENGLSASEYTLELSAGSAGESRLAIRATRRTEAWFAKAIGRADFSVAIRTLAWARSGADGKVRAGLSR